jgi:tRNA-Thr(GGU) m(6)t(6)A37 methyltransferase TsaA
MQETKERREQEIRLSPIGVVHRTSSNNNNDDDVRNHAEGLEATVEIFPQFSEGLYGLEGFSHVFILGYFHRLRPEQVGKLQVRPRGLMKYGLKLEELPTIGVFALDSPTRPNPIGLSLARLVRIEGGRNLVVLDLEFFDGTPVLDVKPYQSGYRTDGFQIPRWNTELAQKAGLPPSRSM